MKPVGDEDIFGELFASLRLTLRGFARTRANSRGVRRTFGERGRSPREKKVANRWERGRTLGEFARVRGE